MIAIVGAGLAGLTAARECQKLGLEFAIYEAGPEVGGRVRSDHQDGFILDHGFQVINPAYPLLREYLDLNDLALGSFDAGALLMSKDQIKRFYDPFRHPLQTLGTLTSGAFDLQDIVKILKLRVSNAPEPKTSAGMDTKAFLDQLGFSDRLRAGFLNPFFRGVLLSPELQVQADFFKYTYSLFSQAKVGLPHKGVGALTKCLANPIPADRIFLSEKITHLDGEILQSESGKTFFSEKVILATDLNHTLELLNAKKISTEANHWSVTTVYFQSPTSPWEDNLIALNLHDKHPINHIAVLTNAQPSYAPEKQHLISVNILGTQLKDQGGTLDDVQENLRSLLGEKVKEWKHLKTYTIQQALPKVWGDAFRETLSNHPNIVIAGDHMCHPSIQGAMHSGKLAAQKCKVATT